MVENEGKKVLIIGATASEYSLAKAFSALPEVSEVFVAPGVEAMKEFCTTVDIRENNPKELLEFALETGIDLTIASSEVTIRSDVATFFQQSGQMIFAPTADSANIAISKAAGKKFMYKTRIACPKFGIFDKPSMALDYLKKSNFPVVLKTDYHQKGGVFICNNFSLAKEYIENMFETGEKKVVIEDYIYGHEFSFYVVTDGFHAIPLGSVATYKQELEGNGGALTSGMGAVFPDYKISKQIEQTILAKIIYPSLNNLAKNQTPYVGIFGVDLILNDTGNIYAIEFSPFLSYSDCSSILANLDDNLYEIAQACVVGSFADDYNNIKINDAYAVSCVVSSKENKIIENFDNLDDETIIDLQNIKKNKYLEHETTGGNAFILTRTARALSKAVEDLYDELDVLKFDGMKYRKDIGKIILS